MAFSDGLQASKRKAHAKDATCPRLAGPEPFPAARGHTVIEDKEEVPMPNSRNQAVKPMPFPGESPTVQLALMAGEKYGVHAEDEKPQRSAPKRRAGAKKAAAPKKAAKRAAPKKRAKRAAPRKASKAKGSRTR
jgi:hypothetical protein